MRIGIEVRSPRMTGGDPPAFLTSFVLPIHTPIHAAFLQASYS